MSHKNCPTKLQVSNLAKDTTHREIEAWMSSLRVTGATVTKKKDSFILEFESAAQAARAKEVLSKNTYINGNVCKVVHYREFMVVGEVTVVVQGLTPDSNFAAIEQAIRQFPGVTEVSFKKKTTKPYAFVSFEKMEQVNGMIKELHGSWVHGDFLRIFIVSDNSGNSPNIIPVQLDGMGEIGFNGLNTASPDGASPGRLRSRSSSFNTQISFDSFLSNISNNLASLTPSSSSSTSSNKRNSYNANFTSFTNPTSFTNTPPFPSPIPAVSPTLNSPNSLTSPNSATNANINNRKSRSKSLNTTNNKVYVPMLSNIPIPIGSSKVSSPVISTNSPSQNQNGTITDSIPITKGRTVSFSQANDGVTYMIPPDIGTSPITDINYLDSKPIRIRSVSFDSNINTFDSYDASGTDTSEGDSPLMAHSPGGLSPGVISPSGLSPRSPNEAQMKALGISMNSPTSRLRSKSVGTVPPKLKPPAKIAANDLFLKQHRSSKIPNPNPSALDSLDEDDTAEANSDPGSLLSPSSSINGSLSLPNLHYKNDYHTLRLEGLDEEITSTILYDLFNCVLDEPPSLLSAKAVHGQGFVDFDNAEMASIAQHKLNGRKFMGNVLRISHVKPEEKCVLKVTNLPFSTDEKDLEEHFSDVAGLISANIVRKVTGISKGFAFLVFGHLSAAEQALQEKHGTIVQGRPINIRHHNSNNTNNQPRTSTLKPAAKSSLSPTNDTTNTPSPSITTTGNNLLSPVVPLPNGTNGHRHTRASSKDSGEQPDDAAVTNNSQVSDEDAQKYLQQFSQEFAQLVQKVHSIETNYSHLKDRLKQNSQRIDAAKTKLAEKRLEQMNDDLAYAKQKHESKTSDESPVSKPDGELETSEAEKEKYQAKKMRAMKQASLRKIIEELSDQLKLAKIVKDIEEEKQLLENHEVQLEMIEMINSLAETTRRISIPKLKERIAQSNATIQEKTKVKDDFQRFQELKRSYDIDLDTPSPPRSLSMSAWPNDEAVKIDTFQLHFTDDRFSLRCCNIQLTRASIRSKSFNRGSHLVYWIKLASEPKAIFVAKGNILSKGPEVDKLTAMQDITSQLYANNTAKAFNEKRLGKTVEFVTVQLLCFYQRNPQVYMTLEPALDGIWKLYDKSGLHDAEKNAFIHAYSHFSYEYSLGKLLVSDIQGIRAQNRYYLTSPNVHYIHPDDAFGKGNQGQAGIDEFFRSHTCNRICRGMNLTPHYLQAHDDDPALLPSPSPTLI